MLRLTRFVLAALVGIALLFGLPSEGSAEGPGTGGRRVILQDEMAGPYRVRVVTSPTPPRVETLYVEVRVTDPESGEALTDVSVQTMAEDTEGQSATVTAQASHDIAPIPTEYAAHLPVSSTGVWRITIQIDGPEGQGEVSFLTRVSGSATLGVAISVGLPIAGLALLVVLFLYLQRASEQEGSEATTN